MAMRWKKDERETGLRAVSAGPRGSKLRLDGETVLAVVRPLGGNWARRPVGWYFVAGWSSGIPYCNTCDNPVETEAEAKEQAMAYVKKHLHLVKKAD